VLSWGIAYDLLFAHRTKECSVLVNNLQSSNCAKFERFEVVAVVIMKNAVILGVNAYQAT
jgi:hypothetical protein